MKRLLIGTLAAALLGAANAQDAPKLETATEKFSYSMGYRMTREMMSKGLSTLDADALVAGVRSAVSGEEFPYSREELTAIMDEYRKILESEQAGVATANAEAGSKFLTENEKAEGVQTLPGRYPIQGADRRQR